MRPSFPALAMCLSACLPQVAVSQSLPACKPVGWATRDGRTGGPVAVTGGGDATPVVVKTFADLEKYARDEFPRVIHIDGTLGSGWKGQSGDRLKITGKNKTIAGLRPGTRLNAAIRITEGASNIILRNLVVQGPGSDTLQGWDNLVITSESPDVPGPKNIWVDHCEFWDGQDGNADVVLGSDNVTFTWNIFGYRKAGPHNLSNLIGSGNSETISQGRLNVTYMYNWWTGAAQRQPRCRYGDIHVANNLLSRNPDIPPASSDYGMAAGKDCRILAENNVFAGIQEPFSDQFREGTSALATSGNLFEGTTGNQLGWGATFTPPYEYKSMMAPASEVKDLVQKRAGANLASPTSCATTGVALSLEGTNVPSVFRFGRQLVLRGFEASQAEIAILELDGRTLHRATVPLRDGSFVLDLPALPNRPGMVVASVKVPDRTPLTARIQNLR